mgnify:CR=1 FL=1
MSSDFVMGIAREALETMLLTSMPVLLVSLVVGVGISILQAVTQIQEQTISFVPKIAVTFIALLFLGPWLLNEMSRFLSEILENFPYWIR